MVRNIKLSSLTWIIMLSFLTGFGLGLVTRVYKDVDAVCAEEIKPEEILTDICELHNTEVYPDHFEEIEPLETACPRYVTSTYIYETLSDSQKGLYDRIYNALLSKQYDDFPQSTYTEKDLGLIDIVPISEFGLSYTEIYETWFAFVYDKTEFYYLESNGFSIYIGSDENEKDNVYVLLHSKGKYKTYESRKPVDDVIDESIYELSDICFGLSEADKAIEVCKYLAGRYEYAYLYGDPLLDEDTGSVSSLFNNTAVCGGYAAVYSFLCRQKGVDLECIYVTGMIPEGYHAWNYVCVDGTWYGVDATAYDEGFMECLMGGKERFSDHIADPVGVTVFDDHTCLFGYKLPELSDNPYSGLKGA